ncbi:sirohydrochlorin chelatase [Rarobacter incanus]|uniref:Sirohydrochlorin ferrochelatase n=1 Tax=Rarobacter incanus TaxID=153494 RepID=A0A542SQL8_9MICO|nr:CbiX/SirB N-terminal domain-containing protein [Rarobacter incanus]TQK76888.1 sirohydrochlorin ferrochelatase [Rarobacter incanus]
MTVLIACSHGTSDPAGQAAIRSLVDQVRELLPSVRVEEAFVDVQQPDLERVLAEVCGEPAAGDCAQDLRTRAVVVPLLLSTGYHTKVDIARAVGAHAGVAQGEPLGAHPLVARLVTDRLIAAVPGGFEPTDRVVLAAAGSSNPAAVRDVAAVAAGVGQAIPVPVTVGYASASEPRIADAVAAARADGASRVIVARYVLAPGFFAELVAASGGDIVSAPLAPDPTLARVVADHYAAALAAP